MNIDSEKLKSAILSGGTISSNMCELRMIDAYDQNDAELILGLRQQEKGNFLKKGSETLNQQIEYLKSYQKRFLNGQEIYYKIFDKKRASFEGVVRITQLDSTETLNWESLVVSKVCTPMLPIDVMIMVYDICFTVFCATKCGPWEVRAEHHNMMKIHDFCKMYEVEKQTSKSFWISVSKAGYERQINRFKKLGLGLALDDGI